MKDSTVQSLLANTQSVETEESLVRDGTLLMTGYKTMEIGEGAASVHIELERLAVKLRVAVAVAPAMRERISVRSVQARNIPVSAKYFGNNDPVRFSTARRTRYRKTLSPIPTICPRTFRGRYLPWPGRRTARLPPHRKAPPVS